MEAIAGITIITIAQTMMTTNNKGVMKMMMIPATKTVESVFSLTETTNHLAREITILIVRETTKENTQEGMTEMNLQATVIVRLKRSTSRFPRM